MKAAKRFYGKSGRWYDHGDTVSPEDAKGLPKGFLTKGEVKKVDKVVKKVSTKNAAPKKTEDKNKK